MNYQFFIAKRYFKAKRKTGFISIITFVSILGVMIGVAALDIVLSSFNGFEDEVRTRLFNADAHIQLRKYYVEGIDNYREIIDTVLTVKHVIGASPVISREGVARSRDNNQPAAIRAVDPATVGSVNELPNSIVSGKFDLGMQLYEDRELPGIVLGRYLAESLMIFSPDEIITLFIIPQEANIFSPPRVKQFVVTGISEIGFYEYDKVMAYISIEAGQKLFNMPNSISWIEIKLDNYNLAGRIAPIIEKIVGGYPYVAKTWFELNRSLYSWMTIEKWGAFLILCLIIMVAAFNIVSSLIMIVMEKTREIGILKSMGASSKGIMQIFLFEGIIVGLIGTIFGSATYPAYKASKLEPVEAIRFE